jgi:hypothetical protein
MRASRVLRVCVLALILGLFTLLQPVSFEGYPPVLLPPGGGVSIGLAQGGEEEVGSARVVVDEPPWPDEGTELVERRSLTSKTYQVGPDQYQALISTLPMHYMDEQGSWQDIDTTIQPQPDGSFYSGANLVKARFPGQLGAGGGIQLEIPSLTPAGPSSARTEPLNLPGATAQSASEPTTLGWQPLGLAYSTGGGPAAQEVSKAAVVSGALGAVSNNLIRYDNAFPGVTEEYAVLPGAVKHSLVLSTMPEFVPANPAPDAFLDYQVELSLAPGLSLYVDGVKQGEDFSTSSVIELRRGAKEVVAYVLPAYAYEQDNPREFTPSTQAVHVEAGRLIVTVRTPMSWLAAPERTYPVVIDPWTSARLWQDTMMAENLPTYVFGYWDEVYAGYLASWGRERMLMQWSVDSIPAASTISNAYIWLYQSYAGGTVSPCTLAYFRMTNWWFEGYASWYYRFYGMTWNSPGASNDYYGGGYELSFDTSDGWKGLGATGIGTDWVRGWIDGTYPNYGVMVKPWNVDSYVDCERGFLTMNLDPDAGPYLDVYYTFTGGTPTTLYHNSAQTYTYPNPEHYYVENPADTKIYWRGTALRPKYQSDYDLWLHTQSDYSAWQVSSEYGTGRVDYTLTKEYVSTTGYPRVVNFSGDDEYNIGYMYRLEVPSTFSIIPPYAGGWVLGSNALWGVWEVYLDSPGTWQVVVTPYDSDLDLGAAIHDPGGADYQSRSDALALSDQLGTGLTEKFEFVASSSGYYGLVVWSNLYTGALQPFLLEVKEPPLKSYLPTVLKNYRPPAGPFSNGGFEDNSRWVLSGELEHERTTAKKRSGSYSLRLGHDDNPSSPCLGSVPCSGSGDDCESVAIGSQGFDVPDSGSPALSFYYQIYTYDHQPSGDRAPDYFGAFIREVGSVTETLVYMDDLSWVGSDYNCDYPVNTRPGGWRLVSPIDLSPYKKDTVELIFRVTNGGHNFWNTWVFIDDVVCSGC